MNWNTKYIILIWPINYCHIKKRKCVTVLEVPYGLPKKYFLNKKIISLLLLRIQTQKSF